MDSQLVIIENKPTSTPSLFHGYLLNKYINACRLLIWAAIIGLCEKEETIEWCEKHETGVV